MIPSDTELTPELFFELLNEARENPQVEAQLDHHWFDFGKYEGTDFIIVDSHEAIGALTAVVNGYTGNLNLAVVWKFEELNSELNKAETELEKALIEHPEHLGTHGRLRDRVEKLLNLSAYLRWLHQNNIDEVDIDKFGIEIGFNDEYSMCCHCYQEVVRTSPDSYSWTPPLLTDEGYVCDQCASNYSDYVLEEYKNVQKSIPEQFSTSELGLVKINEDSYQNGLHYGMDDTPEPIIKNLNNADIDVWFKVYPSQFNIDFDVYVKEADEEKAIEILSGTNTYQGFSSAGNCEKALKEATAKMSELSGEGIKYAQINSDGTADVRLVSNEDFVKGIK